MSGSPYSCPIIGSSPKLTPARPIGCCTMAIHKMGTFEECSQTTFNSYICIESISSWVVGSYRYCKMHACFSITTQDTTTKCTYVFTTA